MATSRIDVFAAQEEAEREEQRLDREAGERRFIADRPGVFDRYLYAKVVGVTHENPDGTSRQGIIERLQPLEQVHLNRDPTNEHDHNAIEVCALVEGATRGGGTVEVEQFGFVDRELAFQMAPEIDSGRKWSAVVSEVHQSGTRGVTLLLLRLAAAALAVIALIGCSSQRSLSPQFRDSAKKAYGAIAACDPNAIQPRWVFESARAKAALAEARASVKTQADDHAAFELDQFFLKVEMAKWDLDLIEASHSAKQRHDRESQAELSRVAMNQAQQEAKAVLF